MDDQSIFLSKSEHHFLVLIGQARGILGRRVPETIVSVIAEQIFGRSFKRAIKNLENHGHLVNTADGYRVAHGLLKNPQVRIGGCEIELIGATQLQRLCNLYNQQPDRELKTSDLYEEDTGRPLVHWKDVVWQVAAELRYFVPLVKDEELTFWIINKVALGLGHKSIDTRELIRHMIEEMALATNHDKTWRLLDPEVGRIRSSNPAKKLSNDQRRAILQEIPALEE